MGEGEAVSGRLIKDPKNRFHLSGCGTVTWDGEAVVSDGEITAAGERLGFYYADEKRLSRFLRLFMPR